MAKMDETLNEYVNTDSYTLLEKKLIETKKFSEAQFKQILELQKINDQLKTENNHLKSLLGSTVDIAQQKAKEIIEDPDEVIIAEREIKKLKTLSESQALTLEECKKLTEFVKIIQSKRAKGKAKESENLSTDDLLNLIKST